MKKEFELRYDELYKDICFRVEELIEEKGVKSKFSDAQVLKLKEKQQFSVAGNGYVVEISEANLIDSNGLEYHYSCLGIDQLCEIVDSFE